MNRSRSKASRSRARAVRAALALAGLLASPRWTTAQTDYRNLDDERPVLTEDATPVDRYAFELLLPASAELGDGTTDRFILAPELEYGLLANTQVGVKIPLAAVTTSGTTGRGLAGPRVYALYNFSTETTSLPALSLRGDLVLPVGSLAGDDARFAIKGIATRSWGRTRAHVNAAWGFGSEEALPEADVPHRWFASLAVDRTLYRQSVLLIAEVLALETTRSGPTEVDLSLGVRWQLAPTLVLDAGVTRRLTRTGPDVGLSVGIAHAFAWPSLMRRPATAATAPTASAARSDEFYYPGSFNWRFLARYPTAARLFNAFDYGHAVLYERLLTVRDSTPLAAALAREYTYLTTDLLLRPPRFAVVEEAIEPAYARMAWSAKQTFDWAHTLHRQIYDVYADPSLTRAPQDSLIERLTDYYLARTDLALAPVPKVMALMDDQPFSKVFRKRAPDFNGLIWAYHWLQVGLYEPFLVHDTPDAQRAGVSESVARFREMLSNPPHSMPAEMPMTPAVAPRFTEAHPRAAAIFDNLHMLHDIISDILLSDLMPRSQKGVEIVRQLAEFRERGRNTMSREEWYEMARMMSGEHHH